jgi:hypothetical protein
MRLPAIVFPGQVFPGQAVAGVFVPVFPGLIGINSPVKGSIVKGMGITVCINADLGAS